jgi:hypothetical protein
MTCPCQVPPPFGIDLIWQTREKTGSLLNEWSDWAGATEFPFGFRANLGFEGASGFWGIFQDSTSSSVVAQEVRFALRHEPSATCFLSVTGVASYFAHTAGSPDPPVFVTDVLVGPLEWNGSGAPCFGDVIWGDLDTWIITPDGPGWTEISAPDYDGGVANVVWTVKLGRHA